jgi:DNA-binding NtrC family response regulator
MEKGIVVLDSNENHCLNLCSMLNEQNYRATPIHSLNNLLEIIDENSYRVLILDLDTISVDNILFRKLKKTQPSLCIVGLSSRQFHPELEEALTSHIYACLKKPVDEEELVFCVKSFV